MGDGDIKKEGLDLPGDDDVVDVAEAGGGVGSASPVSGFPAIKKRYEDAGHHAFDAPAEYYKTLLANAGNTGRRLHQVFQQYVTCKDPKDKPVFRQQIISVFWDFFGETAKSFARGDTTPAKKYLLRFALLHPGLLQPETRVLLSKVVDANILDQSVYYLDEWFSAIAKGTIHPSTTDEAPEKGNSTEHLSELGERAKGKIEGLEGILRTKDSDRRGFSSSVRDLAAALLERRPPASFAEIEAPMDEAARKTAAELQEAVKNLVKTDREIESTLKSFDEANEDLQTISGKIVEAGGAAASLNTSGIETEAGTVRQLAKMTVGRQGNAFPILTGEFYHNLPNSVGIRENVVGVLSWIESIDAECFIRVYRNQPNRIVPYVILIPGYGNHGACWEPIDRANRATGRGRIAVPMYPANLTVAVLTAIADFRWQAAKEAAAYMWMEEGLTGNYYQWFTAQKIKGDVRAYFIQDYILWLTKESEGVQKLDKDLRGTFWRYMPFTQPVKEKLKTRNLIYQELYQRDLNRAKSSM